ncbi:hypothetical protein PC113_g14266 [Phytophthora cactorum]|uniref:Necrosis inducing protein n=1 Tax=Phytophthora cactorum TaxID=29920 RepID=A0A8T0YN31_9STRA|nr:hypothetical protein PC113_g14266 [Phytophthora cactorum]
MKQLLALLVASCALAAQAMETLEVSEDVTFDSAVLSGESRKLAGEAVDTAVWPENYTPGEVTTATAQDEERAIGVWPTSKGMVPLTRPRTIGR